jgi:hypothetical protein
MIPFICYRFNTANTVQLFKYYVELGVWHDVGTLLANGAHFKHTRRLIGRDDYARW